MTVTLYPAGGHASTVQRFFLPPGQCFFRRSGGLDREVGAEPPTEWWILRKRANQSIEVLARMSERESERKKII